MNLSNINIESVVNAYIKKDAMYDVFKDCKEAMWDRTLDLFIKCGKDYYIFNQPEIEFHIQGHRWYYLDITTSDFFIRIEDEKEFYYYHKKSKDDFNRKINNKNIKAMFKYISSGKVL